MMLKIWRYSSQECSRWPSVSVHWHHWHSTELSTVQETWTHVEGNGFWCGVLMAFYPATFLALNYVFVMLDDMLVYVILFNSYHWCLQRTVLCYCVACLWCITITVVLHGDNRKSFIVIMILKWRVRCDSMKVDVMNVFQLLLGGSLV